MVTVKKCLDAYVACLSLKDKDLPFKMSYALTVLMRKLEPCFEAFTKEEKKLIEYYAAKGDDGKPKESSPGVFSFDCKEDKEKYIEKIENIRDSDAELEFKVRTVPAPENIPPAVLMALADFLEFEGVN